MKRTNRRVARRAASILAAAALAGAAIATSVRATELLAGCPMLSSAAPDWNSCVGCHSAGGVHPAEPCHPIDFAYAPVASSEPRALRSADEVARRGVSLPAGEIRCATCHAPSSPWRYHLALPQGSVVSPAVSAKEPASYEKPSSRYVSDPALLAAASRGERPAVTPRPLCLSCHSMD